MTTSTTAGDERRRWQSWPLRAIVDYAAASHARASAVLLLVALLAFLPGFFQIPPLDRDEARFAQASKQMVESGDYVDIRYQDEIRYKKPVGIYWLQAGLVKTAFEFGFRDALGTIWLYRLPSLFGAIGAVLLTYWVALAFVSRRAALFAGLMMATSIMLGIEARLAKTDALLLAAILVAMGVLARAYVGDPRFTRSGLAGWVLPAMFWTALAGGILIKGPLILMFVGLATATLVVLERSVRWLGALRPIAGLAWMSALVLPWFIAIVGRAGEAFFAESIGQDLLAKVVSSQEAHGAPPGYYFLLFWLTFWPGSALAAMAAPAVWASRYEKGARFLLAWIVPAWILLELVVTKLPHYVLPLYPAIAILIAGIADSHMLARRPWLTRGASWWFTLPVLLGIGGILGLMIYGRQFGLLAWPFAAGAVILGLFAWRLYETDGVELSLMRGMAAAILLAVSTYAVILPSLTALFPSAALARVLREGNCEHPVAAAAGYHEPSLVFLLGTPTRLTDGTNAAEFLRQGGCRYALIEARQERSFLRRADAIGLRYSFGPRIEGLNVASGRPVSIAVYRSEASP